jgi:peroxiredoxin/mono/diheme cytochrome c family protein
MNAVCAALALMMPLPAADAKVASPVGRQIASFELNDHLGTKHSLQEWADRKAIVVVFLGTECPLAKQYGSRLEDLAARYEAQGVQFVGINANQQDSLAEIGHYVREQNIVFPMLKDPGNVVADQFGAKRTPEAFVLDSKGVVRYWGRIDDQYGVGYARGEPTKSFLATALDQLLAGKEVSQPASEPVGCFIGRVHRTKPTGEVTYTKHIAGILHKHCVRCHRPGEVAPFAMTGYDEASAWAETIREVIDDGRMPPWHANPKHGKFYNEARLSDDEKQLVRTWVKNGCPQGDASDLPELRPFTDGWQIPKPDVVYKMPEPAQVPATGVVEYQFYTLVESLPEDKWIKAAEARPGNRQVTHHLILFYQEPGKPFEPIDALFNSIVGFAPGLPPAIYPPGIYRRIPKGSKLILQAHYTPNGSPQTDQSEVGIVWAEPKEVKKEMTVAAALNFKFQIPPGDSDFRLEATDKIGQDSMLYALTPHMHLRGKSFRFEALYPDGREEILLDVPRYDFNWQNSYALAEPKLLPEGTLIRCKAAYDNSEENLANPDPNSTVHWGDQTWNEMMVGTLAIGMAEQDLSLGLPQMKKLASGDYEVTFAYTPRGKVESVYLAGTFNDWKDTATKMEGPNADGRYTAAVTLKPGQHEYKFVVNGKWRSDPGNAHTAGYFRNSVLTVGDEK